MNRARGAGAGGKGQLQGLYGQAAGWRPQGRPRMRWVDNIQQDAFSMGVRD